MRLRAGRNAPAAAETPPPEPLLGAGAGIDPDRLPSGSEKRRQIRGLFDAIAPRYELVNRVITFGLDVRWRRRAVGRLGLPAGCLVVDLACGTGDFCRELAKAGQRPIGLDLSMGMLTHACCSAPLLHADALALPLRDGCADGATCGFALRNLVDLQAFFSETARVVRSGGRIALLDASPPANRLLRPLHAFYFNRVVPLIGGLLSQREAYRYLPKSMAYLPPTAELHAALAGAGFSGVEHQVFSGAQLTTATRL